MTQWVYHFGPEVKGHSPKTTKAQLAMLTETVGNHNYISKGKKQSKLSFVALVAREETQTDSVDGCTRLQEYALVLLNM